MIAPAQTQNRNGSITLGGGLELFPVTHIGTFQGMSTTLANTYRDYDTALRDSIDNARIMRNDCGIMECLEARLRAVALLPWVIEPEDDKSKVQKRLCREMTRILEWTPRFTEFRRGLMDAVWYGKCGVKVTYNRECLRGRPYFVVSSGDDNPDTPSWVPVNGDKIVFRHDDASRLDLKKGQYPFQAGIRVGVGWQQKSKILGKYEVEQVSSSYRGAEPVERGMAYFLDKEDRKNLIIHKHMIEDGSYEDMLSAGAIHGVGVRSRIYWDWVQLQETKAMLLAYMERTHGGMEIYKYPLGNDAAKREIDDMIANRAPGRAALKVPIPNGEDAQQFGVEIVEAGMSGISFMMELMKDYYGHRIKRYILGQTLSTEAGATGMGSGVADLHLETFLQILKYDAANFDDTMTHQLLRWLQVANFPSSKGIRLRYKTVTEDTDQDKKLQALQSAWQMGARIKEADVFDVCGLSAPGPTDRILSSAGGGSSEPQRFSRSRSTVSVPEKYSAQWKEELHPRQNDGKFTSKEGGGTGVTTAQAATPMNLSNKQLAHLAYLRKTGQVKFLADKEKEWKATGWENHLQSLDNIARADIQSRVAKKEAADAELVAAAQAAQDQADDRESEIEAEQARLSRLSLSDIQSEFDEKYGSTSWSDLVRPLTSARESLIDEDQLKDIAVQHYAEGLNEEEIAEKLAEMLEQDEQDQSEQDSEDAAKEAESERRAEDDRKRRDPVFIAKSLAIHAEFAQKELSRGVNDRHEIRRLEADVQAPQVHALLVQNGWAPELMTGSGSTYYRKGDRRLRVSDHEVPETAERAYNKANGGFSWAGAGNEIILPVDNIDDLPVDIE